MSECEKPICAECGEPIKPGTPIRITTGLPVRGADGRLEDSGQRDMHPNCRHIALLDLEELTEAQLTRLLALVPTMDRRAGRVAAGLMPPGLVGA